MERSNRPETEPESELRWLVGVLVELARRFIGHAVKRYPELGSQRQECPKCGYRR